MGIIRDMQRAHATQTAAELRAHTAAEQQRQLIRRNADLAGLTNVAAALPQAVPDDVRFDAIWSNPPILVISACVKPACPSQKVASSEMAGAGSRPNALGCSLYSQCQGLTGLECHWRRQ